MGLAGLAIMAAMTSQTASGRLLSDQLWELLEPLILSTSTGEEREDGTPARG